MRQAPDSDRRARSAWDILAPPENLHLDEDHPFGAMLTRFDCAAAVHRLRGLYA
ncbi:MAG: hypothetical protein PVF27_02635 [Gemmatimonadales bacterium]|jgi:hypothetical protein